MSSSPPHASNHISFEELDDYVQLSSASKWHRKLKIAFPAIVLSAPMVGTVCQAVQQLVKTVGHDCTMELEFECSNSSLGDQLFLTLFRAATPAMMRKSGRIFVSSMIAKNNDLTNAVVDDLDQLVLLHKEAKYRYKVKDAVGSVDLSENALITQNSKFFKSQTSTEEMTKALLAGLKITPPETIGPSPVLQAASVDISKSLLTLLHSSASKLRSESTTPPSDSLKSALSLSDLEASLFQRVSSPSMKPEAGPAVPSQLTVSLKVFSPFASAAPLCGLELKVEPEGYRVVRVTEKPGQDGSIREGDLIVAIDGESLSIPDELNREKHMRTVFGSKLRDGALVSLKRPSIVSADLNPETSAMVERKLNFGLMLLGAGVDWRTIASKLPMAAQQAKLVCQTLGIEGTLESAATPDTTDDLVDTSPILSLRGPAGLVDKAMRQFCVVIVKGALLQQQQQQFPTRVS